MNELIRLKINEIGECLLREIQLAWICCARNDDDGSASILSDVMTILLRYSFQLQKCRLNGRNRYLTMYENSIFQNEMMTFYSNQWEVIDQCVAL